MLLYPTIENINIMKTENIFKLLDFSILSSIELKKRIKHSM